MDLFGIYRRSGQTPGLRRSTPPVALPAEFLKNLHSFLLRLAEGYTSAEFRYGYWVDSLREATPAEIRNPDFSKDNIPTFESGNPLPNEAEWPVASARLSRILHRHYRHAITQTLSRIVGDVLLPHVGQTGTREMLGELSQKAAE